MNVNLEGNISNCLLIYTMYTNLSYPVLNEGSVLIGIYYGLPLLSRRSSHTSTHYHQTFPMAAISWSAVDSICPGAWSVDDIRFLYSYHGLFFYRSPSTDSWNRLPDGR